MKNISEFNGKIDFLLTDIDDTITDEGRIGKEAYSALWQMFKKNVNVIPVTGRPAGWCEMIARTWPVAGVIGENGAFYFRYHNNKMIRYYAVTKSKRLQNQKKLKKIESEILKKVKGSELASDQFSRLFDLAIDFCEDVPRLPKSEVEKIVQIFKNHKAQAKVSSIHVNGWFGKYNKLTTTLKFLKNEFHVDLQTAKKICAFCGDSPNDEPMWEFFPNGFSVANIKEFIPDLKHKPSYIANASGGLGFVEIVNKICI